MGFVKIINLDEESFQIWKEEFGSYSQEFSKWVCNKLKDEFTSDSIIEKKEKELKKELKKLKEFKKLKLNTKKICNQDEVNFIKDAKIRFKKDNSFFNGIFIQYKNLFGKRISEEEFRELIR